MQICVYITLVCCMHVQLHVHVVKHPDTTINRIGVDSAELSLFKDKTPAARAKNNVPSRI